MIKNPIYQFKDESSLGIGTVPNETIVVIENYMGTGLLTVLKVSHSGINSLSTIDQFITRPANWINFFKTSSAENHDQKLYLFGGF